MPKKPKTPPDPEHGPTVYERIAYSDAALGAFIDARMQDDPSYESGTDATDHFVDLLADLMHWVESSLFADTHPDAREELVADFFQQKVNMAAVHYAEERCDG